MRNGFSSNNKQIWITTIDGEKIAEVTDEHQYDHSMLAWNFAEEKPAFQRYLLSSSDSKPEVWVWKKQSNQFNLVAKKAAYAIWLP